MPIRSGARLAALALSLTLAAPALAAAPEPAPAPLSAVSLLRPGQFVWFDEGVVIPASTGGAATSGLAITVSLADQRAYVFRDRRLIGVTTVSTGSAGRETPVGEFTILQKKPFHRSNLYSNAPMPFMQRLTWGGIALHAGHLPGYPASHGCIRMPAKFAEQLFEMTEMGGAVSVIAGSLGNPADYAPIPAVQPQPAPQLLANVQAFHVVTPPVAAPAPIPAARSLPAPMLVAETRGLGGASFDMLTMSGDPPALSPTRAKGRAGGRTIPRSYK